MRVASQDPVLETCAQILDHTSLQASSVAHVLGEVTNTLRSVGYTALQSASFADAVELAQLFARLGSEHRALANAVESWEFPVLEDPSMLHRVAEVGADTAHELDGVAARFDIVTALLEREGLEHRARHVRTLVPYVLQLRQDCGKLNILCSSTTQPLDP